jgi:hypothetical protein
MLRACAIDCGKNWDKHLSLAEFAYNNSYQSSLRMAPFEALYGRRCRTPLNWSQPREREVLIKEGNLSSSRWEISFISRYHPPKECRGLESKAS